METPKERWWPAYLVVLAVLVLQILLYAWFTEVWS